MDLGITPTSFYNMDSTAVFLPTVCAVDRPYESLLDYIDRKWGEMYQQGKNDLAHIFPFVLPRDWDSNAWPFIVGTIKNPSFA